MENLNFVDPNVIFESFKNMNGLLSLDSSYSYETYSYKNSIFFFYKPQPTYILFDYFSYLASLNNNIDTMYPYHVTCIYSGMLLPDNVDLCKLELIGFQALSDHAAQNTHILSILYGDPESLIGAELPLDAAIKPCKVDKYDLLVKTGLLNASPTKFNFLIGDKLHFSANEKKKLFGGCFFFILKFSFFLYVCIFLKKIKFLFKNVGVSNLINYTKLYNWINAKIKIFSLKVLNFFFEIKNRLIFKHFLILVFNLELKKFKFKKIGYNYSRFIIFLVVEFFWDILKYTTGPVRSVYNNPIRDIFAWHCEVLRVFIMHELEYYERLYSEKLSRQGAKVYTNNLDIAYFHFIKTRMLMFIRYYIILIMSIFFINVEIILYIIKKLCIKMNEFF